LNTGGKKGALQDLFFNQYGLDVAGDEGIQPSSTIFWLSALDYVANSAKKCFKGKIGSKVNNAFLNSATSNRELGDVILTYENIHFTKPRP